MKNFIKSTLVLCLLIIVNSCSKDEKVQELPKEVITLEDGLDIKFEDLTVVTIDGEGDVNENGDFQANVSNTLVEDLPILFTKGNEIMFGYYSKTGVNNTVSIDDMLLFFFTGHPELSIQGLDHQSLMSKIKESSSFSELKEMVKTSLESNTPPVKNTQFMSLLNSVALEIIKENSTSRLAKTKGDIDTYEINYDQDGKMTWKKEFPLFATVGLEIVNLEGTERKQYLLESAPLLASPNAGFWWVYNLLKDKVTDNVTESYQFPKEGRYKIFLSNGVDYVGTEEFEKDIDFKNRFLLGSNLVSLAFPIGLKKWVKPECAKELSSLFFNLAKAAIQAAAVDDFKLEKFTKDTHEDIYKVVKECVKGVSYSYYDRLLLFFDQFNKTQTGAELGYLIRDYVFTNISSEEIRYFYDGKSYGELKLTNISGQFNGLPTSKTEFIGVDGSVHLFKAMISEDKYKYEVNSDFNRLLPSVMEQKRDDKLLPNFPYIAKKLSGDATQVTNSSTTTTNSEGELEMTFKMGTQDSQFEIKPAFDGKGLPEMEVIDLKFGKNLRFVLRFE